VSLFCRHNRLTANCPICSRELESELRAKAPPPASRARGSSSTPARGGRARSGGGSTRLVTRRLARAADDGYRSPLAPGLRATADAERLAAALTAAVARLEPPGPYPEIAAEPDLEEATWLAFLLALAGPDAPDLQRALLDARPAWADGAPDDLPPQRRRTADAYRAWAARSGSQAAAFAGDAAWTPERRFARVFERLALPGFGRAPRFDLLTALGAAGRYELRAGELQLGGEDDVATQAAKRLLVSGDRLLLERRARELAEACQLPIAAFDRGLAVWGTPGAEVDLTADVPAPVRAALGLR
jgi:hypothetical protein